MQTHARRRATSQGICAGQKASSALTCDAIDHRCAFTRQSSQVRVRFAHRKFIAHWLAVSVIDLIDGHPGAGVDLHLSARWNLRMFGHRSTLQVMRASRSWFVRRCWMRRASCMFQTARAIVNRFAARFVAVGGARARIDFFASSQHACLLPRADRSARGYVLGAKQIASARRRHRVELAAPDPPAHRRRRDPEDGHALGRHGRGCARANSSRIPGRWRRERSRSNRTAM